MTVDYCPTCEKKSLVRRSGSFRFHFEGKSVVIPKARWEECRSCGERVFGYAINEAIEKAFDLKYRRRKSDSDRQA